MADVNLNGSTLGNALQQILDADDLKPGDQPSYQLCKAIYTLHPLGGKMADAPITMAQSQAREISVPESPGDMVREAFVEEWRRLDCDRFIANVESLARVYGIASLALMVDGVPTDRPVDYARLSDLDIAFNVYDPLNTAGSLVLNQNTDAMDFQKATDISVNGKRFHRSRAHVVMNEQPVYIDYTMSAFGFVGRSVYQRALYPLKSFLQTMITDDMISRKAGVLIAKMKQPGSIVDRVMTSVFAQKRALLQQAKTDNVLGISPDEDIQSLNLQNIDGAGAFARTNILKNIATAADMPAKLLENETLVAGFGEGTEDAKNIARYIDRMREKMAGTYAFFDRIVMHRAWNPEFYRRVQREFPDWSDIGYTQAFYAWANGFRAQWPSLLTEPESEKIKVQEAKYKAIIAMIQVLEPMCDPENKGRLVEWAQRNFNQNEMLFQDPLELDTDALANYTPLSGEDEEPKPAHPFAAQDALSLVGRINREIVR